MTKSNQIRKGDSVTGLGRLADTRYQVITAHRDGTYTVRALFMLDENGEDRPGSYLGYKYRVSSALFSPLVRS